MKKPKRVRFEVVPNKRGGWLVTRNGEEDSCAETKRLAVEYASTSARCEQPSQLFIKGRDGRIQQERTYGSDPFPPRG